MFRMRTCRKGGEGSMRSCEGVYVTVYLHCDQHCSCTARVGGGVGAHLTTSPTLTLPVWWSSNMLRARSWSRRCSLRDCDSKKYEGRASEQPASGLWASEYVRGVSSISGGLVGGRVWICAWRQRLHGSGGDVGGPLHHWEGRV